MSSDHPPLVHRGKNAIYIRDFSFDDVIVIDIPIRSPWYRIRHDVRVWLAALYAVLGALWIGVGDITFGSFFVVLMTISLTAFIWDHYKDYRQDMVNYLKYEL